MPSPPGLTAGDTIDIMVVEDPGWQIGGSLVTIFCGVIFGALFLGLYFGLSAKATTTKRRSELAETILPFLLIPAFFFSCAFALCASATRGAVRFNKKQRTVRKITTFPLSPWRKRVVVEIPFEDLGAMICRTHIGSSKMVSIHMLHRGSDNAFPLGMHGVTTVLETPLETVLQLQWATYLAALQPGPTEGFADPINLPVTRDGVVAEAFVAPPLNQAVTVVVVHDPPEQVGYGNPVQPNAFATYPPQPAAV